MQRKDTLEDFHAMIRHLAERLAALGTSPALGATPEESWSHIANQMIGESRRTQDSELGKKLVRIRIRKTGVIEIVTPSGELIREEPKRPNQGPVRTLKMQSRGIGWIALAVLYQKGHRRAHEYGWYQLYLELPEKELPRFPLPLRKMRSYDFGSALRALRHDGVAQAEPRPFGTKTTRQVIEILDGLEFSISVE